MRARMPASAPGKPSGSRAFCRRQSDRDGRVEGTSLNSTCLVLLWHFVFPAKADDYRCAAPQLDVTGDWLQLGWLASQGQRGAERGAGRKPKHPPLKNGDQHLFILNFVPIAAAGGHVWVCLQHFP